MKDFLHSLRILPRWIIILIDQGIIFCSLIFAWLLRYNFDIPAVIETPLLFGILLFLGAALLTTFITQSYAGIIRYTSLQDGWRITFNMLIVMAIVLFVNYLSNQWQNRSVIPYSVIIITSLNSIIFLFFYRLLVKSIFSYYFMNREQRIRVLIFGAGNSGIVTKHIIDNNPGSRIMVVGFLEDNPQKIGKASAGVRIYDAKKDFPRVVSQLKADELIIAITDISVERKNEIVDQALLMDVKVRTVPPMTQWVKGEFKIKQIKEVKIEDLLGREAIELDNPNVRRDLKGKVVMVTGAAGSIGSELVMQIIMYQPFKIVLVDQSESSMFLLQYELQLVAKNMDMTFEIGDITHPERMKTLFALHKPDIIYHAAAYKHVPLMENNPKEAVHCNVIGTKLLADLAVEHNVSKFVFVSTDKAVNPTNVMGASKRIAEIYIQALHNHLSELEIMHTKFVTTRFGNVLGSNGSVIPLFKKQIEKGGPLTVTHPEITRFFMTISEAAQLVMEAGAMGKGGEIFIFDMGESIRIVDLAHKMIRLSGLEPERDIKIIFSGLREGEKLYEELLNDKENTMPTYHEKILIANVRPAAYKEAEKNLAYLAALLNDKNDEQIVQFMKKMVPEYISNASKFEILDKKLVG
ncbi:polysaccharide biosynthesis protein [Bacteroidota bacterium]